MSTQSTSRHTGSNCCCNVLANCDARRIVMPYDSRSPTAGDMKNVEMARMAKKIGGSPASEREHTWVLCCAALAMLRGRPRGQASLSQSVTM
eukprot:5378749-Prymnesium_polylepis.1